MQYHLYSAFAFSSTSTVMLILYHHMMVHTGWWHMAARACVQSRINVEKLLFVKKGIANDIR